MNPFPITSPPSRIRPSVTSPSLLTSNDHPTLPSSSTTSKQRTPKPFLLRSTTPLHVSDRQKNSEGQKGEVKDQAVKMVRSKTDSSLGIHSTAKSSPTPPAPPPSSNSRRSSRPLTTTTNRDTIPIRASRKITFVPDSKPPPSKSANSRPSSSISAARAQAVEKQKLDLKRESLLSRRNNDVRLNGGNENSENVNPVGLPQSKRRWSLRPLQEAPRRSIAHSSLASLTSPDSPSPQNRRPRSPSPAAPSNLSRSSSSNLRDRLVTSLAAVKPIDEPRASEPLLLDSPVSTRPPLRGPSPSAPTPPSTSSSQLQKKASYAGLSRMPRADMEGLETSIETKEATPGFDNTGPVRVTAVGGKSGYTSLHEILAERGYQDTRVLTPMSKARAKTNNLSIDPPKVSETSTSLLSPPTPQVKEKSSMLSLRGLFSLWRPVSEVETSAETETGAEGAGTSDSENSPPSPGGALINSPISRAREWVEGVAIANHEDDHFTANIMFDPSPVAESISTCASPPFQYSLSTDESPVSCRSYSSSIVTASSIRSPPQVTIALPQSTVALSPPSFHRFPSTLSSSKPTAIKSLRHVVSDSTLPQHLPHYQSFPFSPSSLDSSPSSPATEHLTSPLSTHLRSHALAPPTIEAHTSWLPNALRQRASQVFSLPMVGLGLTSTTTPLFPHQVMQQAQSGIARSRNASIQVKSGDKKPRLLRKAVSSAGLVRPVLTTTNY